MSDRHASHYQQQRQQQQYNREPSSSNGYHNQHPPPPPVGPHGHGDQSSYHNHSSQQPPRHSQPHSSHHRQPDRKETEQKKKEDEEGEDYLQYRYPHNIQKADHGTVYVPPELLAASTNGGNSEVVVTAYAPKALDHIRRGHRERFETRSREYYASAKTRAESFRAADFSHPEQPPGPPPRSRPHHHNDRYHDDNGPRDPQRHHPPHRGGRDHLDRGAPPRDEGGDGTWQPSSSAPSSSIRGGGGDQGTPTVVSGLHILPLLDRISHALSSSSSSSSSSISQEVDRLLDGARMVHPEAFEKGKAVAALVAGCARRREARLANTVWDWGRRRNVPITLSQYNAMMAVAAADRKPQDAIKLLHEMSDRGIAKNEVTFSYAIASCEKVGDWRTALELLDSMEKEGVTRTAMSYNSAISACEKGMVPQKAFEVFQRMKREGVRPSVVSYSALISAAEKGSQWKLALEILDDMKADGFQGNVIAYSAAISALAKGQQWEKALDLFREIQACGKQPSIVTYNATMTALEKGLQWEQALELFDEMKRTNLPITVVSYGSALSACDKGLQFRQCLEFLDEMTEMGIPKNVIIFGAAMSCMEKCCRADICFQLMERMKLEGIQPNVHIYNSVISACARNNLWEKGYELFREMDEAGVKRDVVTFNAVLDAVASQVQLGRMLFEEGVKQGFYARVSRLAKHWFELDLHFLSLGGGEIAMGWWFEVCLVPYLVNKCEKLKDVKSISIVTGYGKTRTRGRRQGDDGMRKRCRAMLSLMGIRELDQPNLGRLHLDMDSIHEAVEKNGGTLVFDLESYVAWKERETSVNQVPDVPQKIRPRYRPEVPGSGRPPFVRMVTDSTSPEYRNENPKGEVYVKSSAAIGDGYDRPEVRHRGSGRDAHDDGRRGRSSVQDWGPGRRGSMRSHHDDRRLDDLYVSAYESRRPKDDAGWRPDDRNFAQDGDRDYRRPSSYVDGDRRGGRDYDHGNRDGSVGTYDEHGRSEGSHWQESRYGSRHDSRNGGRHGQSSQNGVSGRYDETQGGRGDNGRDGGVRRSSSSHDYGRGEARASNGERQSDYRTDRKRSHVEPQEQPFQRPWKQPSRGYALEPEN